MEMHKQSTPIKFPELGNWQSVEEAYNSYSYTQLSDL